MSDLPSWVAPPPEELDGDGDDFLDPTPVGDDGWPEPPELSGAEPDPSLVEEAFSTALRRPSRGLLARTGRFTPRWLRKALSVDFGTAIGVSLISALLAGSLSGSVVYSIISGLVGLWVWFGYGRDRGLVLCGTSVVAAGLVRIDPLVLASAVVVSSAAMVVMFDVRSDTDGEAS